MGFLETLITWLLLIASAVGIGLAIRGLLRTMGKIGASTSALPVQIGAGAGLVSLWFILFDGSLPFLALVLAAILVGVVVRQAVLLIIRGRPQIELAVAGLVTVAAAALIISLLAPTTLFLIAVALSGIAAVIMLVAGPNAPPVVKTHVPTVAGVAAVIGVIDWLQANDRMSRILNSEDLARVATTLWVVILAVGISAAVFVVANLAVERSRSDWPGFTAAVGALGGFILFGLLDGNRLLQILGPRESVATGLHDAVHTNDWTLTIVSVLIGGLIGLGAGWGGGTVTDERQRWAGIGVGVGAFLGLTWGVFYAERIPVDTSVRVLWTALIGAILCGTLGYLIGRTEDARTRLLISVAGGIGIGLVIAGLLKTSVQPRLETLPLILSPVVGAAIGGGLALVRRRDPLSPALLGAALGWIVGTFGAPTLGGGPEIETYLSTAVAGGLLGARFGIKRPPDALGRAQFEQRARGPIFLGGALAFVAGGLVIPLLRTLYLSFLDAQSVESVGFDNYRSIFTDPKSFDYTGRLDIFGSQLLWYAGVLLAIAVLWGLWSGRRTGNSFASGPVVRRSIAAVLVILALLEYVLGRQTDGVSGGSWPAIIALVVAGVALWFIPVGRRIGDAVPQARVDFSGLPGFVFGLALVFLAMATFSTLRGTIFNNLWWVFTVTLLTTTMGLVVAVLADRARYESVAKSFIFMPLAISFVGAGIIWRFMYLARDPSKDQTGVINAVWVWLGRISTEGGARVFGIVLLTVLLGSMVALFVLGRRRADANLVAFSGFMLLPLAFALYRFTIGGGLGGTGTVADNGVVQGTTILFLQDSQPFNNLWLMLVLIWIQTGFATVIFSAAIKAVPAEYIEAAQMDGADDGQVFWRITLPSIAPTIGVVVTTLMVLVMKVFDIVKVMTNGNFDTQVIANEMWQRAFTELNFGLGSALAVVLFLSVVPVMANNIRRMQREI